MREINQEERRDIIAKKQEEKGQEKERNSVNKTKE